MIHTIRVAFGESSSAFDSIPGRLGDESVKNFSGRYRESALLCKTRRGIAG